MLPRLRRIFFSIINCSINLTPSPRKEFNLFYYLQEMENLVADKIVEMLSSHSEVGKLRRECDSYKETNEKWKRKMAALQKMCQDLNTVMRRYITDVQKEKEKVAPIKITRSVGLQVISLVYLVLMIYLVSYFRT